VIELDIQQGDKILVLFISSNQDDSEFQLVFRVPVLKRDLPLLKNGCKILYVRGYRRQANAPNVNMVGSLTQINRFSNTGLANTEMRIWGRPGFGTTKRRGTDIDML